MTHVNGPPAAMGLRTRDFVGTGPRAILRRQFCGTAFDQIRSHRRGTLANRRGSFEVDRGSLLVLNCGQNYTITIEPDRGAVETLCVFFRDGYVEQGLRRIESALDTPFETCGAGF